MCTAITWVRGRLANPDHILRILRLAEDRGLVGEELGRGWIPVVLMHVGHEHSLDTSLQISQLHLGAR